MIKILTRNILFVLILLHTINVSHGAEPEIIIDSVVDNNTPYIQQAIKYTLRIWRQSTLEQGYFVKPEITNAIILDAQSETSKKVVKNGMQYNLLEKHYFLIPLNTGLLTLPAPVFSGRKIFYKGNQQAINVKPPPALFDKENWLIAQDIKISESWQPSKSILNVGELLERTIIFEGQGVIGVQLPEPVLSAQNVRIQKISDQSSYTISNEHIYGRRVLSYRYLWEAPGEFIIPTVSIHWWNTITRIIQKNSLSERKIDIKSGLDNKNGFKKNSLSYRAKNSSSSQYEHENFVLSNINQLIWVFLIGLLSFIIILFLSKRIDINLFRRYFKNQIVFYPLKKQLLFAINQNNWLQVKTILLEWANRFYPNQSFNNLLSLSEQIKDAELKNRIIAIDEHLYGNKEMTQWDSKSIKNLLRYIRKPG